MVDFVASLELILPPETDNEDTRQEPSHGLKNQPPPSRLQAKKQPASTPREQALLTT
ncbi:Hypothetical predicted protein [Pelobates cultripes]|uniref:Uncharacterized protein n=1 Tax=Pelobates cultripes TaxID=61616 RepID=A0AAD1SFH5_PELCU|nr:Hypothetical predicted protein [Pelobates cultripes]